MVRRPPTPNYGNQPYQLQTYASPSRLVRYPHRRRLEIAIELVAEVRSRVVVDYGAGDGELAVRLLADPRGATVERLIAFDPTPEFHRELTSRLGGERRVGIPRVPSRRARGSGGGGDAEGSATPRAWRLGEVPRGSQGVRSQDLPE